MPPGPLFHLYVPLRLSQCLRQALLSSRAGPFKTPAVTQTACVHGIEAYLVEQLRNLLSGGCIVAGNWHRAAILCTLFASIAEQVCNQDCIERFDLCRLRQMLGEEAAGGGFVPVDRQRTAKLRCFIDAAVAYFALPEQRSGAC